MKRLKIWGLLALLIMGAVLMASCISSEDKTPTTEPPPTQTEADFTGRITKVDPSAQNGVLGIVSVEGTDTAKSSDKYVVTVKHSTVLHQQQGEIFSPISFELLAVGQQVKIWFSGPIRESYPAQADAARIVVYRQEFTLDQEFSLALGQSAAIRNEDFQITFKEVLGDSRCPEGATCIWAGEVKVAVDIKQGAFSTSQALTQQGLSGESATAAYGGYQIAFKVLPYPKMGEQISRDQYRLVLKISKLNNLPTGRLQGRVKIGPIRPVERPGDDPYAIPPETYDARKVMVYDQSGKNLVKQVDIGHDGRYSVDLPPGTYEVDINRIGIDRSSDVPRTIKLLSGEIVTLDISIDTGIR